MSHRSKAGGFGGGSWSSFLGRVDRDEGNDTFELGKFGQFSEVTFERASCFVAENAEDVHNRKTLVRLD